LAREQGEKKKIGTGHRKPDSVRMSFVIEFQGSGKPVYNAGDNILFLSHGVQTVEKVAKSGGK
jgi:hypothetical protein